MLSGKRFANDEEVSEVDDYFEELNGSQHKQAVEATEHRCEKLCFLCYLLLLHI